MKQSDWSKLFHTWIGLWNKDKEFRLRTISGDTGFINKQTVWSSMWDNPTQPNQPSYSLNSLPCRFNMVVSRLSHNDIIWLSLNCITLTIESPDIVFNPLKTTLIKPKFIRRAALNQSSLPQLLIAFYLIYEVTLTWTKSYWNAAENSAVSDY